MAMKLIAKLLCVYLLSVGAARAGDGATLLTFDDVALAPGDHVPLYGYGGLEWSNFSAYNSSLLTANFGYRAGMVSAPNVAFNDYGDPASIRSSGRFNLISAYLTAGWIWDSEVQIRVQGFVGTSLMFDHTYAVN